MGFENESTFVRMAKKGNQKEFNRMYEDALKDVTKFLGQEYPNIIGKNVKEGVFFYDAARLYRIYPYVVSLQSRCQNLCYFLKLSRTLEVNWLSIGSATCGPPNLFCLNVSVSRVVLEMQFHN